MHRTQIKPLRESLGLSQRELAELADTATSFVSQLERESVPANVEKALYDAAFRARPRGSS